MRFYGFAADSKHERVTFTTAVVSAQC
ncbi:uncharacterized protein METZ01_LOCUS205450 [marine metagenome]|uniref:Uncharacterized protein n=1 Tax=marine metagenome TaxID=408172 RepID=A0A382EP74_9ZZZZ